MANDERDDAVENARTGYQAAVSLWTYEGAAIWARYNAMLVANSIVMAVIGLALTSDDSEPELAVVMSFAGMILCGAWAALNWRGFDYHQRWIDNARKLESHLRFPVETVSQGGLPGLSVECVSYLPVLIFGVMYAAALVLAFD